MVSQIAYYNFAINFLSNKLLNMNFGLILTTFEPFIGQVPVKAKSIKMNMIIKIPLMLDFQADFFKICCK